MTHARTDAFLLVVIAVAVASADDPSEAHFNKQQLSDQYFAEGAGYGDFNQDRVLDVVSGPFWYEGPNFEQRHQFRQGEAFPNDRGYADNFFSFGHDVNGDGWTDIVEFGFPGREAHWFENPRDGSDRWTRHLALSSVGTESPALLDITGDGRLEIVCAADKRLGFATLDPDKPTEPWTFHAISEPGPWTPFTHGLGVGDINGDGRKDVLTAFGWFEQPQSLDGDPLWKPHPFRFCRGGAQMFAYDVDGDGDNDVITSKNAHAYGLSWFENSRRDDGKITFAEHVIMGAKPEESPHRVAFSQLHALSLHDMDGDGLKDIVTGKCYWAHNGHDPGARDPAVLYYFRLVRDEDAVEFDAVQVDDDSGVGRQVSIADLNGDDRPDIIVANKKGVFVFQQAGAKSAASN